MCLTHISDETPTNNLTKKPKDQPIKFTPKVFPKRITLPTNTATLTALPDPKGEAPDGTSYTYKWTSINSKKDGVDAPVTMGITNKKKLDVSDLYVGKHKFKVKVTGTHLFHAGSEGEAVGLVTVSQGKHTLF